MAFINPMTFLKGEELERYLQQRADDLLNSGQFEAIFGETYVAVEEEVYAGLGKLKNKPQDPNIDSEPSKIASVKSDSNSRYSGVAKVRVFGRDQAADEAQLAKQAQQREQAMVYAILLTNTEKMAAQTQNRLSKKQEEAKKQEKADTETQEARDEQRAVALELQRKRERERAAEKAAQKNRKKTQKSKKE